MESEKLELWVDDMFFIFFWSFGGDSPSCFLLFLNGGRSLNKKPSTLVCQQKLPKRPQDIQKEIDERNNLWVFLEE